MATINADNTASALVQLAALRSHRGIPAKDYSNSTPKVQKAAIKAASELLAFDFDERSFYVTEGNPETADNAHRYFNLWRENGTTEPVMVKVPVNHKVSRIIVRTK